MNIAGFYLDLQIVWYVLVGVVAHRLRDARWLRPWGGRAPAFRKKDEHRRLFLNAIGPVWDGNEVCSLPGRCAFRGVSRGVCHGFFRLYLPFMLLLCALIFPRGGDRVFAARSPGRGGGKCGTCSSPLAARSSALLIGVAMVILCAAIPLDQHMSSPGHCLDC